MLPVSSHKKITHCDKGVNHVKRSTYLVRNIEIEIPNWRKSTLKSSCRY